MLISPINPSSDRGFLFRIPLWFILSVCLLTPVALGIFYFDRNDELLIKTATLSLLVCLIIYAVTYKLIPYFSLSMINAGLFGKDLNKPGTDLNKKPKIPEGLGVIPAITFMIGGIISQLFYLENKEKVVSYNAGLLSICMMILLGALDDFISLKWRYKLIIPTIAALPLMITYSGITTIVIPIPFRGLFGTFVELGLMYKIYMMLFAVFSTNAINIYAGINGLEVGQSIVIGSAVLLHNTIEIILHKSQTEYNSHVFSLSLILPFLGASLALFMYNKFPSRVFIGDSFCYWAGMVFAVLGITGHFTKTLMLFFIPQIINFLISLPQLMGIIKCPRHRLPRLNQETHKLEWVPNHYTLINAFLKLFGPTNEKQLNNMLLIFQILCVGFAFWLRYEFTSYVF